MRLKKGKIGYMAIKIDLEKAYDRLEWPFIDDTLDPVLWNGAMSASFNPSRGLRQGDPLSPYLFVMCMKRLGHAITGAVNNGRWKPIRLCSNIPALSHLFFADDLVLLAEASIEQCDVIQGILELFCKSSGQKINMQKTTIYYSKNVDLDLKNSINASFGFQEVQNLGKYLGVPLLHSQITKASYSYIVSRVGDKLTGWKEKSLSLVGRITLAKTILSVIPSYSMQSMMLPKGICKEIEQLIRGFIWGRTENRGELPLVHWENICKPTVNGGLDFWREDWLCDLGPLASFVVNIAERDNLPRQSVSFMVDHNGQWRWEFIIDKLPNTIVQILCLTLEANRAMKSSLSTIQLSHRSCTMPDVWQPPPHNWCKINTDGSRDIGSGFASCGGVLRSSNGGWMFGFSKAIGICSIVEAELWGIHEGFSHAWNLGERNWNVDLKHISRNANKVTDRLAKIAVTRGEVHIVFSTPPWKSLILSNGKLKITCCQ
ncbi:hypothetical protein F3Y22_tig00109925pilonHSYRG00012 [Hibiscus syriacus]|uniref:Reverse transcriptase domain-containing protein n=1 Tax=Hibiscus syriacus TaxID=106335 RepID=A0A6A3BXW5_HIBSY|nr:hypothetical protein F3Y22_tig00109925pilonHSYRG00012 [Hibiscus syriacus]